MTGKGVGRWARSWIFKYHGVDSRDYSAQSIAEWVGHCAAVETEVHPAYLKLVMRKSSDRPDRQADRLACVPRLSTDRTSSAERERAQSPEEVLA